MKVFYRIYSSYEQTFRLITGHEIDPFERDFQLYHEQRIRKIYTLDHPEVVALALKIAYQAGDFKAFNQDLLLWIDRQIELKSGFYGFLS